MMTKDEWRRRRANNWARGLLYYCWPVSDHGCGACHKHAWVSRVSAYVLHG